MALSTYAELQAGVLRWLSGYELEQLVPDFVALAEAQINRDLADKPLRPMIAREPFAVDSEFHAVPDDMVRPVSFTLDGDPVVNLKATAPENIDQMDARDDYADCVCIDGARAPAWYAVVGPEFRFWPAPETAYTGTLTYVQKIPALSDAAPSNWLLAAHPDVYLYGALAQAALTAPTGDDRLAARGVAWAQAYNASLDAVRRAYPAPTNKARLRTELPLSRYC